MFWILSTSSKSKIFYLHKKEDTVFFIFLAENFKQTYRQTTPLLENGF